jgi:hypothetical protein
MDEKELLLATLKLHELTGNLLSEAENLLSQIEYLDMATYELFSKLNPFDGSWAETDTWDEFRQQVIDYCKGATK